MNGEQVLLTVLVALVASGLVVLVARWWGRESGSGRDLAEIRARLDRLVESQQDVPRVLAEEGAIQARSLAEVRERLGSLAEAARRMESIGDAVGDLQQLLRVPKLRGTLGELWLAEMLRQVLPESLYQLEYTFQSGERVDAVVRLRDRLVPIDAKFPLEAWERMTHLEGDEAERERRAFQRSLRARIDEIADKYIRPQEGTYEFALMYVPAESIYYEAVLRGDTSEGPNSVLRHALDRKVIIVSPTTFYAYLAALAHGLRGLEVEASAREILDSLSALQLEFEKLQQTVDLLGRHLANAVRQHEDAARSTAGVRQKIESIVKRET